MDEFAYYAKLKPLRDTQVIRKIIACRDRYQCAYCTLPLKYGAVTLDHVVPKSEYKRNGWDLGSATNYGNMAVSCQPCNLAKASLSCEEFGIFPRTSLITPTFIRLDHHGRLYLIQSGFVEQFYSCNLTTHETTALSEHPDVML